MFTYGGNSLSSFTELGVAPQSVDRLETAGIRQPFPIQTLAIPLALTGHDVIAQARTGTGKTLAFGLPLLQRLAAPGDGRPRALIVAPTRELAIQVADDLTLVATAHGIRVTTIYGGRAYEPQLAALTAGTDVVVGTPGRLLDLCRQRALDLSRVEALVLDEADEMLDLGFLPDVEKLIARTPASRQTMLFSATMPAAVVSLARRYMRQPTHIRAEDPGQSAMVPTTAQHVFRTHRLDKPEVLVRVLQVTGRGRTLVFCRTKRGAATLADTLRERGFTVGAVHGDLDQQRRERALQSFRDGRSDVLVATDVAARGIDVTGLSHVVNYDVPDDEKTYLHRIGRTGRAGGSGTAITFVDWSEITRWQLINDALGLPFREPVETYSTSPHLFAELGIPEQARSAIGAATAQEEPAAEAGGRSRPARTARTARTAPTAGTERPARPSRRRRRTRGGRPQTHDAREARETGDDAGSAA